MTWSGRGASYLFWVAAKPHRWNLWRGLHRCWRGDRSILSRSALGPTLLRWDHTDRRNCDQPKKCWALVAWHHQMLSDGCVLPHLVGLLKTRSCFLLLLTQSAWGCRHAYVPSDRRRQDFLQFYPSVLRTCGVISASSGSNSNSNSNSNSSSSRRKQKQHKRTEKPYE